MDPSRRPNQVRFQNPRRRTNWKKNTSKNLPAGAMPRAFAPPPRPHRSYAFYPPSLYDFQFQNHIKSRRFYEKKCHNPRFAPYAPRNTTSFLIRAKKSGGIASLISPSPVTPAILPTPKFSPTREGLVDMAKEEWGVDGYGSMNGLIRLKSPKGTEDEGDGSSESSESDVEEHVEVERRLDHDLSRFEMVYPAELELDEATEGDGDQAQAEARVARLEEENLTLRERLFLVETEMDEIRKRLENLEKRFTRGNGEDVDGSNGVHENLNVDNAHGGNREDVDGSNVVEKNMDVEDAHGSTGGKENVDGEEDVDGGNGWEENVDEGDVYGGNGEDASPVSIGTPVRY